MGTIVIPQVTLNNTKDREKLMSVIREVDGSYSRLEGERTYIREALSKVAKDLNLSKKMISRMAKVYHKQNVTEEVESDKEFAVLYEAVTKVTGIRNADAQPL